MRRALRGAAQRTGLRWCFAMSFSPKRAELLLRNVGNSGLDKGMQFCVPFFVTWFDLNQCDRVRFLINMMYKMDYLISFCDLDFMGDLIWNF